MDLQFTFHSCFMSLHSKPMQPTLPDGKLGYNLTYENEIFHLFNKMSKKHLLALCAMRADEYSDRKKTRDLISEVHIYQDCFEFH